jgi:hypothetical protein
MGNWINWLNKNLLLFSFSKYQKFSKRISLIKTNLSKSNELEEIKNIIVEID